MILGKLWKKIFSIVILIWKVVNLVCQPNKDDWLRTMPKAVCLSPRLEHCLDIWWTVMVARTVWENANFSVLHTLNGP